MESSLQNANLKGITNFFKQVCIVINDHEERTGARKEMYSQIKKVKTAPKKWILDKEANKIHKTVDNVLDTERRLFKYGDDPRLVGKLNDKIDFLEERLSNVKIERDKAVFENREKIREIQSSIRHTKEKISLFIKAKEKRDKKLKELEKRIRKA